jgi:hypothetical protein
MDPVRQAHESPVARSVTVPDELKIRMTGVSVTVHVRLATKLRDCGED